ncbi:hypothetical protein [Heliomarina baculiformis]|uniref:hypothetical protein n=1 Tax=Heliomarina baculiformis TaxID=2872036 RepID=UPI001EE2AEEA|nr:hypothetical protein [Heliomarina baculiformis]
MLKRIESIAAFALMAMLLLASVTSAGMMAPDRHTNAYEAFELIHGVAGDDFCGTSGHADHHCPFCHGLPESPSFGHEGELLLLTPYDGWLLARDLHRSAQTRNINHSPRAPPEIA